MAVRGFRKRYISFVIDRGLTRKEMITHLNRIGRRNGMNLRLTVFDGKKGIVLVSHLDKERAIEALNSYTELNIRTIKTSGTIKKAKASLV